MATRFYSGPPRDRGRLAQRFATAHRVLTNKYYVDELYGKVFVRGLALGGGNALFATDRYVVDGGDGEVRPGLGVNGIAWLTRDIVARLSNFWDKWIVDGSVNLMAAILDNLSYLFRAVQNGLVQSYALSMLIGVFLLLAAGPLPARTVLEGHRNDGLLPRAPPLDHHLHAAPGRAACCCSRSSGRTTTRCAGSRTPWASSRFLVSLPLWFSFDRQADGFQFVEKHCLDPLASGCSTSSGWTGSARCSSS